MPLDISKYMVSCTGRVSRVEFQAVFVINALIAKLLKQGYRYHKLRKVFSKVYRRHYELISSSMSH